MRKSAKEKAQKQKLQNEAKARAQAKAEARVQREAEVQRIAEELSLKERFFPKSPLQGKNKKDEKETRQARHDFLERLRVKHGPLEPDLQSRWSSFRTQLVDVSFREMHREPAAEFLMEAAAEISRRKEKHPGYLGTWMVKVEKEHLQKEPGATV